MSTFITPYSGSAELTAGNGLNIDDQGRWKYSQAGYNDGATFGLSLTWPDHLANGEYSYGTPSAATKPVSGGELHLSATNWTIAVIGNELTEYTDPNTSITYTPAQCRILITGEWQVIRERNSNSWNSIGVTYDGLTETDLGSRPMNPWLLSFTFAVSRSF